jgi:hypothetical protein
VTFELPTGHNYAFTTRQAGTDTAKDSDGGTSDAFTVQAGDAITDIDAGVIVGDGSGGGCENTAGTLPNGTIDEGEIKAYVGAWQDGDNNAMTDGAPEGLTIVFGNLAVAGACMTYRKQEVSAQAKELANVNRNDTEEFYFDMALSGSKFIIFRGSDFNLSFPQYRKQIANVTNEAWNNMTTEQKAALQQQHKDWIDSHVNAHRMTGSLNVTYEYAANGNKNNHNWTVAGRRSPPYSIQKGEFTPEGSLYPYGRALNLDNNNWMQDRKHSADKPAGWDDVAKVTIEATYHIDVVADITWVKGTITIIDVDGTSTHLFDIGVTEV